MLFFRSEKCKRIERVSSHNSCIQRQQTQLTATNGNPQHAYLSTYLCWRHAHRSDGVSRSPPQSSSLQRSTPCAPLPQQHGWLSAALLLGAPTSATFHAQAPLWLRVLRPSLCRLLGSHQANHTETCDHNNKRRNTVLGAQKGERRSGEHKGELFVLLGQELLCFAVADRHTSPCII